VFTGWCSSKSLSNTPGRVYVDKPVLVILMVLSLAPVLMARVVRPRDYVMIDRVRVRIANADFDTTRALADTLTENFYMFLNFYNQHLKDRHNQVELSFNPSRIYPDTLPLPDQSDSLVPPDSVRWLKLDCELDYLRFNMYALQRAFNRHLINLHGQADTLIDAVFDLVSPESEMTNRKFYEHGMKQLGQMLGRLYGAMLSHILNLHLDPKTEK